MAKQKLPQVIRPIEIDGIAALMVAQTEHMTKLKDEKDTAFVKRIVAAYFNAVGVLGVDAISER